jgi:hypothetical protein
MRHEAKDMISDLRGVMIVRDPLEMVVSAYVYHHRGAEDGNPMQIGIPQMGPEETGRTNCMGFCHRIDGNTEREDVLDVTVLQFVRGNGCPYFLICSAFLVIFLSILFAI